MKFQVWIYHHCMAHSLIKKMSSEINLKHFNFLDVFVGSAKQSINKGAQQKINSPTIDC